MTAELQLCPHLQHIHLCTDEHFNRNSTLLDNSVCTGSASGLKDDEELHQLRALKAFLAADEDEIHEVIGRDIDRIHNVPCHTRQCHASKRGTRGEEA